MQNSVQQNQTAIQPKPIVQAQPQQVVQNAPQQAVQQNYATQPTVTIPPQNPN